MRFRQFTFRMTLALLLASGPICLIGAQEGGVREDGWRQVSSSCDFSFPEDHGPHPDYRTEWWYYTGNLADSGGRRFGFQLTFFRSGLQPPHERQQWPDPSSPWRTDQIYLAHAAISDLENGRHYQAERMVRAARGLSGAVQTDATVTLHINDWRAVISPEGHRLEAETEDFTLRLDLSADKAPVAHGDGGYSRKGSASAEASCYYSFTRLSANGTLTIGGDPHTVQGSAWMDHEFSTAPLAAGITGWDWFSLQLSNRSEVMIYLLRQADGSVHPASSGSYVGPEGRVRHIERGELTIQPLSHWTSPHTGARYPVRWQVVVAPLDLELTIDTDLADQEMHTPRTTGVDYWEGSVRATGSRASESLTGKGYVELTGYAKPFDAPM